MLRGFQAVRWESSLDVAIGGYRFIRAVAGFPAFELINVLAYQVTLDPVAGDKG
jgi:hypothetical protein